MSYIFILGMAYPLNEHFITEYQLYMETRNKFLNEVGILRNECPKTVFVNLPTSKNKQLIQSLAQFITNCFVIRSVVSGRYQG